MQIHRHWLVLAGCFGLTATMLGAYGAHGLAATGITPERLAAFNTAVQYQFFHALALLVLGWCGVRSKVITLLAPRLCWGSWDSPAVFMPWCCLAARGWGLLPRPVASVLCWDGRP